MLNIVTDLVISTGRINILMSLLNKLHYIFLKDQNYYYILHSSTFDLHCLYNLIKLIDR